MRQLALMLFWTRATSALRIPAALALVAAVLELVVLSNPAWARGKPPPAPQPIPDIVYMSNGVNTPTSAAIRGVTLASDGLSGTDTQLAKAKAHRGYNNVVWSPDGTRYAWIEGAFGQTRSIMIGAPGQAAATVYSSAYDSSQPYPGDDTDELEWGPGCSPGTSVLVFSGIETITARDTGIFAIDSPEQGGPITPRVLSDRSYASGFALSPTGQHLAFRATSRDEKVWMLPMCTADKTPVVLVDKAAIGATDDPCIDPTLPPDPETNTCYADWAIRSIDWSRHGDRLALSVTVGPDLDYPWRDLKIVYLSYLLTEDVEQVTGYYALVTVNLDSVFGAASSEHSPRWGPSNGGACQRIAFVRSGGVIDGSDFNGRHLYLLDVNDGYGSDCQVDVPLLINSKVPRAIDWK